MEFRGTTICAVRRSENDVCIGGDGQVTFGENTVMKHKAKKVRKIYEGKVVTGFAGSVADAITLIEKFEKKLDEHGGNLKRAAVALAQLVRNDEDLRRNGADVEFSRLAIGQHAQLLAGNTVDHHIAVFLIFNIDRHFHGGGHKAFGS